MNKFYNYTIILCLLLINSMCYGQTPGDFEGFNLEQDTFLNGADGSQGFTEGSIFLPNSYDDTWGSWSGWAISTATDNTTPGFTNQYSSISGSGHDNSRTYATTFVLGASQLVSQFEAPGGVVHGFYINNATYSYLTMRDGDDFAKKFGGEEGTDPDFFYVSIKAASNETDSLIFYLADYRSDNPEDDYIVDEWTYIDLAPLNANTNSDIFTFELYSSDKGAFGMNTPAYFCIDNIMMAALTSVTEATTERINIYPNPTGNILSIDTQDLISAIHIYDHLGRLVSIIKDENGLSKVDMSPLDNGQYVLLLENNKGSVVSQKLIKQ